MVFPMPSSVRWAAALRGRWISQRLFYAAPRITRFAQIGCGSWHSLFAAGAHTSRPQAPSTDYAKGWARGRRGGAGLAPLPVLPRTAVGGGPRKGLAEPAAALGPEPARSPSGARAALAARATYAEGRERFRAAARNEAAQQLVPTRPRGRRSEMARPDTSVAGGTR